MNGGGEPLPHLALLSLLPREEGEKEERIAAIAATFEREMASV